MKIRLHRHPFAAEAPQEFEADSLAAWLLDRYEGKPPVRHQVYAGEPSRETEITGNADAILNAAGPIYTVLESPGWSAVPYVIQLVISLALKYMMAPFDKPLSAQAQQSPNNELSGRENQVRTMQRVEDIYGTVRSIPSLLMPTYNKYVQNSKVEYGYYCVGRGYHDISDVRDGDTPISQIRGASAAVYAPFTSPNSGSPQLQIGDAIIDPVLTVSRSGSVDGITLKPTNLLQLTGGLTYYFYGPSAATVTPFGTSTQDVIWQPVAQRHPNFAAVAEAGQTLTISMANQTASRGDGTETFTVNGGTKTFTTTKTGYFLGLVNGSTVHVTGFADPANNGDLTVASHTGETMTVTQALVTEGVASGKTFTMQVNYSATRTIASVEDGYVLLTGTPQFSPVAPTPSGPVPPLALVAAADLIASNGLVDWTDWFTLPATDRTEVWTNVLAQNGMYKDDGAKSTTSVAYEIQIEQLTALFAPTGVVETVTGSISGTTSNARAETLERVTGWTGPARVRARRTTPFDYDFAGVVVDEITWVDLYSVSPVPAGVYPHFGNKTTIHTVTKATSDSTALRRRELNCIASRKLPTYNGSAFSGAFNSAGFLTSGTISATSRIVDIIAAIAVDPKIGNRSISDLDVAQLWGVQQALTAWNTEAGQFNYTFDTDTLSFEETLAAIANAGFCAAYRQNGLIRLALDRPQSTSVALFTHRNKKPNSETITRQFASDSDYDGVEFLYQDPDTEAQETIRLPLDGSYTKPKKVEITGIRSYEQAWLRANRELKRLLAQRLTIETQTTTDARALLPNCRVDIVDNTRFKSYDGEVVGWDSGTLTATLSRDVAFIPATAHSIVLMKRDGSLQSISCAPGTVANQVVLASAPTEALVTTPTPDDGIRTIFSFGPDSARAAQAWLVQEIGITDGQYVRLRAVNYSPDYYVADEEAIPDKSGVIY